MCWPKSVRRCLGIFFEVGQDPIYAYLLKESFLRPQWSHDAYIAVVDHALGTQITHRRQTSTSAISTPWPSHFARYTLLDAHHHIRYHPSPETAFSYANVLMC
jgi:hypothetical protein